MTSDDSTRVLARLQAAWPAQTITEPQADIWFDHLRDIPVAAGMEACDELIRTDMWFPAVARFREVALAHQRAVDNRHDRALPPPPQPTATDPTAHIADIRQRMGWTPETRSHARSRINAGHNKRRTTPDTKTKRGDRVLDRLESILGRLTKGPAADG